MKAENTKMIGKGFLMKIKIVITFLLVFSMVSIAIGWDYDLKDAMVETVDKNGNKHYSVNMKVIDYYINRISMHAKEYPPSFKSKEEQEEIINKLNQLIGFLEILGENNKNNPDFLSRAAFSYSMGHNVNIKGAAQKSHYYYEKLLEITPESPIANYHYGMFLAGTQPYHYDSIPYLEKALKLGQKDARYTLGLLYYQKGDKEKGLGMLQEYSSDNPNDEHVKKVIEAINSGKLKFIKSD
jgi:tetratricopeptide (TPR) repeat protein